MMFYSVFNCMVKWHTGVKQIPAVGGKVHLQLEHAGTHQHIPRVVPGTKMELDYRQQGIEQHE